MSDDVSMLQDMADRFMETEIAPHYERYEKQEIVDREAWEKAGSAGLLCASVPEKYGGAGGTYAHEAVIAEALGHAGVDGFGIGPAQRHRRALHPASRFGRAEAQMAAETGDRRADRGHRHDRTGCRLGPAGVKTTARKDGNHYVINGLKTFITNGQNANFIIVVMSGGAWFMDPSVNMPAYFMPQGVSADLIATKWCFSRDDVDAYAVESQKRAAHAWENGYFKNSVIPIKDQNGLTILGHDKHMRPETNMQGLASLNASFGMIG